jgi:fermentation-respiration switch protein FrsA (DUF1100 family)
MVSAASSQEERPSKFLLRRFLKLLMTALICLYVLICLALWLGQGHLIFFPSKELTITPAHYRNAYEDVSLASTNGELTGWWLASHESGAKVLLYLHGNGGNLSDNAAQTARLNRLGLSVFIIDYRGYGRSSGKFPSETTVYEDAESAWKYLTEQKHFSPHDIIIYGHSLGGAVAIDLAAKHPEAAGLITESSFTSIRAMSTLDKHYLVFPIFLILNQRFDSIDKVDRLKMPVLFIHGSADEVVPTWMGQALYQAAPQPKRLLIVPGGHHMDSGEVGGKQYLDAVRDFIQSISSPVRNAS